MKRFRFRLEPVLRQREDAERAIQLRVAAVERQRLELEAALAAQQRAIEAEEDAFRTIGSVGGSGDVFRAQAGAIASARSRAKALAVELAGVLKHAEAIRAELAQAAAARRAMELLRDRRHTEFRRAIADEEARTDDDIATAMHAPARHDPMMG